MSKISLARSLGFICLLIVSTYFRYIDAEGIAIEQLKAELNSFFNDTYISKWKSIFDPKLKTFKAKGYKANWEMNHLHHVCISGGKDGIFVGTDDQLNDWAHKVPSAVPLAVWNREGIPLFVKN